MLELVHSNICGSMQTPSISGYYYFATFIDDYSGFTTFYFLNKKSKHVSKFKLYKALVENKTYNKIKTLWCNNGGEYKFDAFMDFCGEHSLSIHKPLYPREKYYVWKEKLYSFWVG